jgi:hypothetical protein
MSRYAGKGDIRDDDRRWIGLDDVNYRQRVFGLHYLVACAVSNIEDTVFLTTGSASAVIILSRGA